MFLMKWREQEWSKIFTLYTAGNKKKAVDFENLKYVTKILGYRLSEEELHEIVEKITDGSNTIDNNNFVQIMGYVQSHGERAANIVATTTTTTTTKKK